MKDQDVMQEIEQLKQQLAALSHEKTRPDTGPEAAAKDPGAAAEAEDAGYWLRTLLKQAEDLIGGLDLQLKDVPAKTALVIFALGVLTGRLLSRKG